MTELEAVDRQIEHYTEVENRAVDQLKKLETEWEQVRAKGATHIYVHENRRKGYSPELLDVDRKLEDVHRSIDGAQAERKHLEALRTDLQRRAAHIREQMGQIVLEELAFGLVALPEHIERRIAGMRAQHNNLVGDER